MRLEPFISSKYSVIPLREPKSFLAKLLALIFSSYWDYFFFSKSSLSKGLNYLAYRSKLLALAKKLSTYDKSKMMLSPFTSIVMVSG